jgi:hypothetical protein
VGEDRPAIDKIEIAILEGEMGKYGRNGKIERRAQVLVTPDDVLRADIEPPDLALLRDIVKEPDHPAGSLNPIFDTQPVAESLIGQPDLS